MTDSEGLLHTETPKIDDEFVSGLAEISFRNEAIHNSLISYFG